MLEKKKFAIVDTMFARGDMAKIAIRALKETKYPIEIVRKTVPGFKDLAVECKILLEDKDCDLAIALGMAGKAQIDLQCAHEASIGIQQAKLMTNKHIIEVFVFENESNGDDKKLSAIMKDRAYKHAINAADLIFYPKKLTEKAGTGQRQGHTNALNVKLEK